MMIEDLEKILNEVPILMSNYLKGYDKGELRTAEGMVIQKLRDDGSIMKYTVINYNCDNMAKTLLHESIHHYYGGTDEWYVEQVEKLIWKLPEHRKLCQDKIVELCGRYDL